MSAFFRLAAVLALAATYGGAAFSQEITGAGATFPAPVYAKWAEAYQKATGVKMNYQSIGSSGGKVVVPHGVEVASMLIGYSRPSAQKGWSIR